MTNSSLLYIAFNNYYNRGLSSLKNKELELARLNILSAAEMLYKISKQTHGKAKKKRIQKANELCELANEIQKMQTNTNNTTISDDIDESDKLSELIVPESNSLTLEESLKLLNSLEGLQNVKEQVSDLIDQVKIFKLRSSRNLITPKLSRHMVFTGNPGTGKTTVARIIGQIYKSLGILSKGHLVEVDRADLVAGYVGQTALKTKEVINQAMGGVLFIDEAYSLNKEGNDFGQEAIDIINKIMEDSRTDLVIIVAGYKKEMEEFINSNQGLRSRFKTYIDFNDYTSEELYNIFLGLLEKNEYKITNSAKVEISNYLKTKNLNSFNGNARDIRNLFENIIRLQSRRLAKVNNPTTEDIVTITIQDLPFLNDRTKNIELSINENEDDRSSKNPISNNGKFEWNALPIVKFSDIAGLDSVKDNVKNKVILPLEHPEALDGYVKKNGGGLFLYGPPGTGKTMIAAAIANEIGAKFCSVKPSDLLHSGTGNTEKAIKTLFLEARSYPCAVIYFDEMDAIAQKSTRASYSKQLRSELLAQIQGIETYERETGNILFLIASTNKPWDVDSAFVRPGRFGTKVFVGLPDIAARKSIISTRLEKIKDKNIVTISNDIDIEELATKTEGFNCSDITNLLDRIEEISIARGVQTKIKIIKHADFEQALTEIHSSVQNVDMERLLEWKEQND